MNPIEKITFVLILASISKIMSWSTMVPNGILGVILGALAIIRISIPETFCLV